jgi:hypothetical protein
MHQHAVGEERKMNLDGQFDPIADGEKSAERSGLPAPHRFVGSLRQQMAMMAREDRDPSDAEFAALKRDAHRRLERWRRGGCGATGSMTRRRSSDRKRAAVREQTVQSTAGSTSSVADEPPEPPSPVSDAHTERDGVYTAIVGTNADLIERVSALYAPPGSRIADVTYGKGVFWRKTGLGQYDFHRSDVITVPEHLYDFRALPYEDASFDIVVFDPPYRHDPGPGHQMNSHYQNAETTGGLGHREIIELYRDGMREDHRILRPGGLLWVKCQDEISSRRQRWSHVELLVAAEGLGFEGRDLFLLVQATKPQIQRFPQQHARKNHSYLWVFEKTKPKSGRGR